MKQIVCEMCESTDFSKEEGMYICQGCGMKYSPEEAKKLMIEVDGAAPKAGGSDKVMNMLTLARNAINQSNNSEAEDYANRILEIDSTNAEAWLIKGQAVGWQSKIVHIRFSEMASCFEHALEHASEEEKESFKQTIQQSAEHIAKAFLTLTTDNFSNYPSEDNVTNVRTAVSAMLELSVKIILMNVDWNSDDIDDFFSSQINAAAVAGSNKADANFGPDESDKNKYAYERWIKENDFCVDLLEQALVFANSIDRIETIVKNHRILQENAIDSCSYKFEATGYWSGYVKDLSLTDSAKSYRRSAIHTFSKNGNAKITEIKEKARKEAEAAQRAKNEAYWNEHAEEKAALETEKAELEARIAELNSEIKAIQNKTAPEIAQLTRQLKEQLPEEKAVEKQRELIRDLTAQRAQLGLFKGKEKKALENRIYLEETPKLNQMKTEADAKRKAVDNEINEKIAALRAEDAEQRKALKVAQDRLNAIKTELTKNR